jgi:hypothetical protein
MNTGQDIPSSSLCDGKVRELPADVVGHPFRSQCYRGIEIAAWNDPVPVHFGKRAENVIFVVAVNLSNKPVSLSLDEFAIVSLDAKHLADPNRAKVIFALNPVNVSEDLAVMFGSTTAPAQPPAELRFDVYNGKGKYVGEITTENPLLPVIQAIQQEQARQNAERTSQTISTMVGWIARTSFSGGVISPHGSLAGFLYFPKIKGANPMFLYTSKEWKGNANLKLPLGSWINSAP